MSEFETGKKYSPDELNALLGPSWINTLSAAYPPALVKDIVYTFNDFNNEVKDIYNSIYNLVKSLNPNSTFSVFAVGDYVSGKWKTLAEANQQAQEYNSIVPPSDYSYWTDAAIIPHDIDLLSIQTDAPIRFDATNDTHKVIIPPNNI
jgi:hypothetical protein